MILTVAEIPRAADVFPLLYADIAKKHAILVGTDPFAELTVSRRHLRLRVEQELREAQIRLRRAVVDGLGAEGALGGAVFRKIRQIRGALAALFELRGEACDDELGAVLAAAGRAYGVETKPLQHAHEHPQQALEALNKLLNAAIADVDARDAEIGA
jgi:hypothetical protein